MRAQDWGGYVGMSILGYVRGVSQLNTTDWYLKLGRFVVTVMLYLAFSYSINNCFDFAGDMRGEKRSRNPIAAGRMSFRGGVAFSILLALAGIALTRYWFGEGPFMIYGLMTLMSAAYSAPPLRLKSVPVLDLLSHALFFGSLIVLYGVSVAGGFRYETMFIVGNIFVLSLIVQLWNQIGDITEDSATGVDTTVTRLGHSRSYMLLTGLLVTHLLMLIYIMNLLGNIYVTSVSLVFLAGLALQFLVKPDEKRYFFVTEKLTPFVYLVFSVIASLAN